jgi:hypothetical protein
VLGPLLSLSYIKDIEKCVVSQVMKFADDTKLIGVLEKEDHVKMMQK